MRSDLAARLVLLLGAVAPCSWAGGAEPAADVAANVPLQQRVAAWTRQLNSDEYEVREQATQHLIQAGLPAVVPVTAAIRGGSWEVTTRGMFVLQELALARDVETEKAALAALEEFAAAAATPVARRAGEALSKLDQLRRQRAVETFAQLGAKIDPEHRERDLYHVQLVAIEIGPGWRGEETDLRRLKWLSDVEQVTLVGEQVKDSWLPHLRGMDNLVVLKLKRAGVTDEAFACLKDIPTLRCVKLLYLPIGDGAVRHLQECRHLMRLKVYGTNVSPAGAERLAGALGVDNVDYRRGAFLGVAPSEPGTNWFISTVTESSAAEKADLRPGDVITRYGDHDVRDFESLTKLIAKNNAGDTVTIHIRRDGKTLVKQVTFGEWE